MAERSEAKRAKRSFASKIKTFSFRALSHFQRNLRGQFIGHFTRKG
jgi:hypothetical protein